MSKKNVEALCKVLDSSNSTAEFLQDVIGALEKFYADDDEPACPEGFAALDAAVQAFEEEEGV
jgi:hypothetical protein